MPWFRRSVPRDTNALYAALTRGRIEDLEQVYRSRWVRYEYTPGDTLLTLALSNSDLVGRVDIAARLLDDGVDVTSGTPVHVLLARRAHDLEREPALLARMLDLGADVNEVVARDGTPLETLGAVFSLSEADLAPFYDVLLARDDLDLTRAGGYRGRPVIETLRLWGEHRPELLRRGEAHVAERSH